MIEAFMRGIERVLALALILAVCLNFANVVGRYLLGRMILGADEVQIYLMVWIAFLGAAVVAWQDAHLRMDLLARTLPRRVQQALRAAERLLLMTLAGFVLVQSSRYAAQMAELGRKSDTAGIPMWLPHSAVAIGFGLIALVALVVFVGKK